MPFEFVEHTADLGVRVTAATLPALFEEAAVATTACLVDPASVRPHEAASVALEAPDAESLLVAWLNELLFRYDTARWLTARAAVRLEAAASGPGVRLSATIQGEPLDPARHAVEREVKAVTHHGLAVEHQADGTLAATVIYDL